MNNELAYDRPIEKNYDNLIFEHKHVLKLVGENQNVLEVGCHTGYFSYWLKKQGCNVTGIDIYRPCIEKASPYLVHGIVGNIEDDITLSQIEENQFDVIILMHVLEHLVNPDVVLKKLTNLLKENGRIIITLPNISNWNSRVQILKGNFNYTETGLMDRTHLRFFNVFTSKELIENSGLNLISYAGVSKVRFNFIPHVRLIWRINKPYNNLIHLLLSKYPNLTDSIMLFEANKGQILKKK